MACEAGRAATLYRACADDLLTLLAEWDIAHDDTLVVPSTRLEVVATRP